MRRSGVVVRTTLALALVVPAFGGEASTDSASISEKDRDLQLPRKDGSLEDGAQILREARERLSSVEDKSMSLKMRLVDGSGGERIKTLRGYEKHDPSARKVLWIFESPLELQGTGFLAWQREGKSDSLWVYFPGQRRVRRVPASLRREQFQGSMFTYEDLIAVFFLDYDGAHEMVREEPCGSSKCLVVESDLEEGAFAYDRLRVWLERDHLLPQRVEFYGPELLKVMAITKTETIDGIPSIVELEMFQPGQPGRTYVEIEKTVYNQGLRNNLFTVEHLSQTGK